MTTREQSSEALRAMIQAAIKDVYHCFPPMLPSDVTLDEIAADNGCSGTTAKEIAISTAKAAGSAKTERGEYTGGKIELVRVRTASDTRHTKFVLRVCAKP